MGDFEELMPKYLNFVKGVVDSDDLPLNVSREQLQQMKMIKVMSKKLVRKAIDMIKTMAEEEEDDDDDEYDEDDEKKEKKDDDEDKTEDDDEEKDDADKSDDDDKEEDNKYAMFWDHFGKSVKLGVIEDASNRNKLAKLLRFYSTNDTDTLTSLDEYISRMKDDQDTILYLPGDSKEAILKSPILEKYKAEKYEVLILDDPVDEYTTQHLTEYEKRKVKSIAKLDVKVLETKDKVAKKKLQKLKAMFMPLLNWIDPHCKEKSKTERVALSQKLVDSPLYIFTSEYGYSATMEKIQKAQAFQNSDKTPGYMLAKKTLEINPGHPIIKHMLKEINDRGEEEMGKEAHGPQPETVEYFDLLVHAAMLQSGFVIEEPQQLAGPLEKLVKVGMGMSRDEPSIPNEFSMSEDEEDEESESEEKENDGLYNVGGKAPEDDDDE